MLYCKKSIKQILLDKILPISVYVGEMKTFKKKRKATKAVIISVYQYLDLTIFIDRPFQQYKTMVLLYLYFFVYLPE